MGEIKETAFGNFLRALAEICDHKPNGPVELTVQFSVALSDLMEKDAAAAKIVLKAMPGFWKTLKGVLP